MSIVVPDPRIEMPSLFYPGRKPVGKVAIDWANSLTRGLTCCLLDGVDLVGGEKFTEVIPSYAHDAHHGRVLSNGRLDSPTLSRYSVPSGADFSLFSLFKSVATRGSRAQVLSGSGAGGWFAVNDGNSFRINLVDFDSSVSGVVRNQWMTAHVARRGTAVKVGLNGRYLATGVSHSGIYSTSEFGVGYIRGSAYQFAGEIAVYYQWNRSLSAKEIAILHQRPYPFLVPA